MLDFIVMATMILGGILIGYGIADVVDVDNKCPVIVEIDKEHCITMMEKYIYCQKESFVDCYHMGKAARKSCGI